MGASLILESAVLYEWCQRSLGCGPLVSHGISMGGHMASLGATVWPEPIALVPCLSWSSGSITFAKGALTGAIPWDLLTQQYSTSQAFRNEIATIIRCEDNAFKAGVEFTQRLMEETDSNASIDKYRAVFNDTVTSSQPSKAIPPGKTPNCLSGVEASKVFSQQSRQVWSLV